MSETSLFLKPLPTIPYELTARFAREQDNFPKWQVDLFRELLYLAKKSYEIEQIALNCKQENVKLREEIKFMYTTLDDNLNKEN